MPVPPTPRAGKPEYVVDLQGAYGPPSQDGFGSAVFSEPIDGDARLEQVALDRYKYFVGDLWDRYGEAAWLATWKEVYTRPAGARVDIVAELRAIRNPDAALSVAMILDNIQGAEQARAALSAAYDDPTVTELRVFNLGDGDAMSGLAVAGRRNNGSAVLLIFLMD